MTPQALSRWIDCPEAARLLGVSRRPWLESGIVLMTWLGVFVLVAGWWAYVAWLVMG